MNASECPALSRTRMRAWFRTYRDDFTPSLLDASRSPITGLLNSLLDGRCTLIYSCDADGGPCNGPDRVRVTRRLGPGVEKDITLELPQWFVKWHDGVCMGCSWRSLTVAEMRARLNRVTRGVRKTPYTKKNTATPVVN